MPATLTSPSPASSTHSVAAAGDVSREQARRLARIGASFWRFLPYWQFINRETGAIASFAELWRGQADVAQLMEREPKLFLLKAGKLGFTELECAFDAWRLRFGPPNCRVHLFSLDQDASAELLRIVRFGLEHLPAWMRLPVLEGEAGSDTSRSLKLMAGTDDVRTVKSWPARENISIDQSCQHAHVDEWCRMRWAVKILEAVQSTVAPGGTLHLLSRGAGPNEQGKKFRDAVGGLNEYVAHFSPWDKRPRPAGWREREALNFTAAGIQQYAPQTWQEALQGDETYVYPQFDNPPGRHIKDVDPCPLNLCQKIAVGVDPGLVNPTAMGIWGERSSGGIHLYDEFYETAIGADEIGAQLAAWYKRHELWEFTRRTGQWIRVAVPSDEKTLAATLNSFFEAQRMGLLAVDANREILADIQLVTQRLNSNALTVARRCIRHTEEFQDYRNSTSTDSLTKVVYAGERPVRHHADAMDEMRYAVHELATWPEVVIQETATGRRIVGRRR